MSVADAATSEWATALFAGVRAAPVWRVAPEERSIAPADLDDGVARFRETTHYELLLRAAVEGAGVRPPADPLILVLGAGTGVNGVAPCLRLFRGARIVATDRTDAQFGPLRRHLHDSGASDRVVCLEMEPESETVPAESFDLVTGASILNRLADPDQALANAFRVLKPGGHALFMEPFDGFGLIRLAFERILAEAQLRGDALSPPLEAALAASASDIAARTMPDPTRPEFGKMEQKWLFSRESLTAGARQIGFCEARFFSHNDHETLYRDFARNFLSQLAGAEAGEMPDWGWDVLDGFDRALPPPVKRLLMLEGTMVLSK
jgi:ubiquinone/menaquinone biosynthesis C-methylase UbiE